MRFRLRSKQYKNSFKRPAVHPDHLVVRHVDGKGDGLFSTVDVEKGLVVCEYEGKYIERKDRSKLPQDVSEWTKSGNYSFFFQTRNGDWHCIDAEQSKGFGGKMNHSIRNQNTKPFVEESCQPPKVFFKTTKFVKANQEFLWDYGERDSDALKEFPFLKE